MNKLQIVLALFLASVSAMPSPNATPIVYCDISQPNAASICLTIVCARPDWVYVLRAYYGIGGQCRRNGLICPL
ncbi:hypothetical protein BD779DRAFT_1676553 [Infundibulicybe gibba]|nr:hypothetical protein BD779DRAFT_1676553 [Infundibulicybe gibba]